MFDSGLGPPAQDVVELTIFGLGFGEAATVHVGNGEWLLIDCCCRVRRNIPLEYLKTIGVPFESVKRIVATHWDMDHVEGLTELVRACRNADLIVPGALDTPSVIQHLVRSAKERPLVPGRFRKAILEYGHALLAAKERYASGGAGWRSVSELTTVYRRAATGGICEVCAEALSPSARTCHLAVEQVARTIEQLSSEDRLDTTDLGHGLHPNDFSIALWVRAGDRHVLLGADLENRDSARDRGWRAVVNLGGQREAGSMALAEVVKVPHHGSRDASIPMVWAKLLVDDPGAVVAPWMVGSGFLPQVKDLSRLADRCKTVCVAAEVPIVPADAESPNRPPTPVRSAGFVRLRSTALGPPSWEFHLGGTAFEYVRTQLKPV